MPQPKPPQLLAESPKEVRICVPPVTCAIVIVALPKPLSIVPNKSTSRAVISIPLPELTDAPEATVNVPPADVSTSESALNVRLPLVPTKSSLIIIPSVAFIVTAPKASIPPVVESRVTLPPVVEIVVPSAKDNFCAAGVPGDTGKPRTTLKVSEVPFASPSRTISPVAFISPVILIPASAFNLTSPKDWVPIVGEFKVMEPAEVRVGLENITILSLRPEVFPVPSVSAFKII